MRSLEAWLLAAALLFTTGAVAAPEGPAPVTVSASAVLAAASAVEADPLLPGTEKTKTLRFKQDADEKKAVDKDALRWWIDLMDGISGGLRVAMWLGGAALLIWVLLRLRDWLARPSGDHAMPALPPTHVGSLDIRPESLPADIGAAARALLGRGEQRAALSLLYRGALSRLVHGHGVRIRAASTESECLALSARPLAPEPQAFLVGLVGGWQAVAYARRELPAADVEQWCQTFDAQLPAAPGAPA